MRTWVAVVVAMASAVGARADLTLEMKTVSVEEEGKRELTTSAWFAPDMAANRGVDGKMRIVRFDKRVIWDVDPDTRRYTETTFARIAELEAEGRKRVQDQVAKLKAMLADPGLPAAERPRVERLIAMTDTKEYAIEEAGEDVVLERRARRYVVKVGGKPFMSVWATEELGNVSEFNRLNELSSAHQPGFLDQLRKIKGVWLRWETPDGARTAVATRISTDKIDPVVFEVPPSYQRR